MADPLRLQIQKALCQLFSDEISTSAGFYNDITSSQVFRGRVDYGESDPLPMISILESPNPLDPKEGPDLASLSTNTWPLLIQGWVADDRENPTDPAHLLLADVKRALAKIRAPIDSAKGNNRPWNLGGLVETVLIGQGCVRPAEAYVSSKAFFWVEVFIVLVENLEDPAETTYLS